MAFYSTGGDKKQLVSQLHLVTTGGGQRTKALLFCRLKRLPTRPRIRLICKDCCARRSVTTRLRSMYAGTTAHASFTRQAFIVTYGGEWQLSAAATRTAMRSRTRSSQARLSRLAQKGTAGVESRLYTTGPLVQPTDGLLNDVQGVLGRGLQYRISAGKGCERTALNCLAEMRTC